VSSCDRTSHRLQVGRPPVAGVAHLLSNRMPGWGRTCRHIGNRDHEVGVGAGVRSRVGDQPTAVAAPPWLDRSRRRRCGTGRVCCRSRSVRPGRCAWGRSSSVRSGGPGATIADQVGLSGTELGIGLAVIRLASLGSLPFIGLADRYGRRAMMLGTLALGLALTVVSAASPGYWWFVVIFVCGRPMLSSTNALAQVAGAEPDRLSWSSVCCSPDRSGLWGRGRSHRGDPQPGFRGARGSGARSH